MMRARGENMAAESEDEIKRIAERIVQLCEAAFADGKEYLLLSWLGVHEAKTFRR